MFVRATIEEGVREAAILAPQQVSLTPPMAPPRRWS